MKNLSKTQTKNRQKQPTNRKEQKMSANVVKLPIKTESKVRLFPKFFTVILEKVKAKQDELRQKKINFLLKEAYIYVYSRLELPRVLLQRRRRLHRSYPPGSR